MVTTLLKRFKKSQEIFTTFIEALQSGMQILFTLIFLQKKLFKKPEDEWFNNTDIEAESILAYHHLVQWPLSHH